MEAMDRHSGLRPPPDAALREPALDTPPDRSRTSAVFKPAKKREWQVDFTYYTDFFLLEVSKSGLGSDF